MTKREREVTDINEIKRMLDTAKVVHIGLVDDGFPYIVPMNYGYELIDGKLKFYLHSAMVGYKINVINKNPNCCFELECNVRPFKGNVACQYGTTYESVMGRGKAKIITEVSEKMRMMSVLMKTQTGMDFEFNEKLVSAVSVIEISVDEFTAKRRPLPEALSYMD